MTAEQKFLGTTARLYIKRTSKFGVYLGAEDYPEFEVLLPGGQVPPDARRGDYMEVFLYKDSEDRLIATTASPRIQLGQVAPLTVTDVTGIGAFLDWGLAKDLFLPFKEQTTKVHVGDTVLAALYVDKSARLCATMHIYDYLRCDSSYRKGDRVQGRIYEILDSFGAFVAVRDTYSALIPHNEMTRELKVGEEISARIKEITPEGKLTLSLQEKVKTQMGIDAERIFKRLEEAGGELPFHDKTSPEIIKREFCISKAAFKRALGRLLKAGKIEITEAGIRLKA